MFFKKKPTNQPRRMRQSIRSDGLGSSRPVFSYQARSERPEGAGARRANKLLWVASPPSKPSPRQTPRSLPKKFMAVIVAIIAIALTINSLILSRDPEVVPLADTTGRRLL